MKKERIKKYLFYGGLSNFLILTIFINIVYGVDVKVGEYVYLDISLMSCTILILTSLFIEGSLDLGIKRLSKHKRAITMISIFILTDCAILKLFFISSLFLHGIISILITVSIISYLIIENQN